MRRVAYARGVARKPVLTSLHRARKPAAKPAGATPQWPPPTVAIAGTEYAVGVMLGKGVWADVFKVLTSAPGELRHRIPTTPAAPSAPPFL